MNIEAFMLCDAATDTLGKLNVLGAFDVINVQTFPWAHPLCAVATRLRFQRIESGSHKIIIHFVDEDGKFIIQPLESELTLNIPETERSAAVNLILIIHNLVLDRSGICSIILAVDGKESARLPLTIKQIG